MAFLTPDDPGYDLSVRQAGFNRYRQCLSLYGGNWLKVNLLTVAGALPLAAGIALSILSSSALLLLPCSFLGGALFGPFLAGLYDAVLRGLRDDLSQASLSYGNWREAYQKSWRQNGRESLLPGALLGLLLGVYAFMAALLWWARVPPGAGTLALYAFAGFLLVLVNTLYWPQLVLFRQTAANRIRNLILFTAKYFWRVAGATLLQLLWFSLFVLFAPWSLLLIPFLGLWYIIFAAQLLLYGPLNRELRIEERIAERDA